MGPPRLDGGSALPCPPPIPASSDLSAPLGVFEQSYCRTFPPAAPPGACPSVSSRPLPRLARRHLGCHLVRKLCVTTPTSLTVLCLLALKISVSFIIAAFYWLFRCPVSVRRELRESRGLIWSAPPYFQALTQWLALVHSSTYHSGN